MCRLSVVRLLVALLALAAVAVPASAGTLYIPTLSPGPPAAGDYKLRVWLTNHGDQQASVRLLRIDGSGDGTKGRGRPETRVVGAGATLVLLTEAAHGLLEIQAPPSVAVNAELRNTSLPGPREVFGSIPVIGSQNLATAGDTLLLQGLRRSSVGVASHVGLVNLGHQKASCDAAIHAADGRKLVSASFSVPALSHTLFPDALTKEGQIADVNARISCNRPFYAYVAMIETEVGELIFTEPSQTGASTLQPPTENAPEPAGGSLVFTRDGTFHTPTRGNETKVFNLKVPPRQEFRKVVLDMDFTHGGWYRREPNKMHNIFWLHRGGCCWPRWNENILGFANAFGPGADGRRVKVTHNLEVPRRPYPNLNRTFELKPGKTYHLRYEYDAAGGKVRLRLSAEGRVLFETSGRATVSRIRPDGSGEFMAYFGHENQAGTGNGAERPSYNWKYSNLRVEFIP